MDASQQFWMSEDLLEHLLPMLDLPTLVNFASANTLAVSVLSRPPMWGQFLKRTYQPTKCEQKEWEWEENEIKRFQQKAPLIAHLLKMMEHQKPRLIQFLDHICQDFPVREERFFYDGEIKLRLGGTFRIISPTSFIVLEHAASHLEFNMMEVEERIA